MKDPFVAISPARRDIVLSVADAAFGAVSIDAITPVRGGASGASTFLVELKERRHLLRLEGAESPLRNPHQYQSMRIAAEAGIAPAIHYIDETARAVVMDFIEARPLDAFPGGPSALARAQGEMVRRLQEAPIFPRFVEYPDIVTRLWNYVCGTGLFAQGVLDEYTEHLEAIREDYVWQPEKTVSSHNDPIPSNILFDGERLWMIDWELAYRNDPLVDVAIMLDNLPTSTEGDFLRSWSGGKLKDDFFLRLEQARALSRLDYAGVMLSASVAASWITGDTDTSTPTLTEFENAVRDGRFKPGAPETKHMLGKMFLASFLRGSPPPGFRAAV